MTGVLRWNNILVRGSVTNPKFIIIIFIMINSSDLTELLFYIYFETSQYFNQT